MRLSAIRYATFGRNPVFPEYAGLAGFFADRSTPYGVHVDVDRPLSGNRNSYAYLSTQMLELLARPSQSPDLVVIAHALPDCGIETSIAGSVQQALTGQPMVFAVTDQGRTTGFAAIQAAAATARCLAGEDIHTGDRGPSPQVAVLILDQGTLVYPDPATAGLDTESDHAVGLLFTPDGPAELTGIRHLTGIDPQDASAVAATELIKLAPLDPNRETVFVLGDGLLPDGPLSRGLARQLAAVRGDAAIERDRSAARLRIRRAPSTQLCTAVWSELAAELTLDVSPAADRTVVVAEYDPGLHCLSLLSIDIPSDFPSSWGAPSPC